MVQPIPLSVLTLYADLMQQVETASPDEATVVGTTVNGQHYLRLQRWVGAKRRVEHLGRADDPAVLARAEAASAEMGRKLERRKLVSALRRLVPAPTAQLGKVLDAVSDAGLFQGGAVLVGTGAFQCYSPVVGALLPSAAPATQDADLATTDLALASPGAGISMLAILQRADPTFSPVPGLDSRAPAARFRSRDGFLVDLLTPSLRTEDQSPMPLPGPAAGAAPMQQLDWLIKDPVSVVALHGAGVVVSLPQPARYAVHKLIVGQKRDAGQIAKRGKDLVQAKALIDALRRTMPYAIGDALDDARARGREGWAKPIDRSLAEIGGA